MHFFCCFLKNNSNESVSNLSKTNVNVEEKDSSLIETDDSANLKRFRVTKYKRKKIYSGKYKCSDCDYKASYKSGLQKHIESIHLGIKYPCTLCEYQDTENGHLRSHMKRIHK